MPSAKSYSSIMPTKYIARIKNKQKALELLFLPALWVLYFVSGSIKRTKGISVYGCPGNRFSDNAKYAYLEASKAAKGDDSVWWISSDKTLISKLNSQNLNAAGRWSLKGIFLCLRAKHYYFSSYCCDINFWTSKNAIHVNYWHGVPFKKIEYDIHSGPLKIRFNPKTISERLISFIWYICSPGPSVRPSYLFSPHPYFDDYLSSAFRVPHEQLIKKQYPRVRSLKAKREETIKRLPCNIDTCAPLKTKIALYAPTFRDTNRNWIKENILTYIDPLQIIFEKNNIKLLIKPHPNEILDTSYSSKNIEIINSQVDTYVIMENIDLIITDYSSIAVDAADAGIDVYLLWPDLNDYKTKSRDLYFNIQDFYENKYFSSVKDLVDGFDDGTFETMNVKNNILSRSQPVT